MTEDDKPAYSLFIDRDRRHIELQIGGATVILPLNAVPTRLYEEIANLADSGQTGLEAYSAYAHSPVHKPFVCTSNPSWPFMQNVAPKIVRLTPTDDVLEQRVDDLEGDLLSLQGKSFEDRVEIGMQVYRRLHVDESKIDPLRLGAIEMYGTTTYHNIFSDPRVSLGFSWYDNQQSQFVAYQLNCVIEVISPGHPFFRYMRAMRMLFAKTYLDIGDVGYFCAYKVWVSEIREKTLQAKAGFEL